MNDFMQEVKVTSEAARKIMAERGSLVLTQSIWDEAKKIQVEEPVVHREPLHIAAISDAKIMEIWRNQRRVHIPKSDNGTTGYMEPAVVVDYGLDNKRIHAFRTADGRPGFLFPTIFGNVLIFQRYNDKEEIWVKNCPDQLDRIFAGNTLSIDRVLDFISRGENVFESHIEGILTSVRFADENGDELEVAFG